MALFMWIDGVPGRPGWDDWFEVISCQFGDEGMHRDGATGGQTQTNTVNVTKRTDASSSAILLRNVHGDVGAASLWASGENDIPLYQFDMTDAIVSAYRHDGSDAEQFQLAFAKGTSRRATDS